jgi:DNA invertase Pin-like site-specific DNA recombinase
MLTVLGGLAEFERELIRARTGDGRERAKAEGVRFGRPPKMTAHQRREALHRMNAGESIVDLARTFGVDRAELSPAGMAASLAARPKSTHPIPMI